MVLGVDEACTNVIRYAYRLRDDRLISLRMEGLRKCVRMRLRDYGEKVFPHEMKGRSHDLIKPGGLGLHLIRYAFDEVVLCPQAPWHRVGADQKFGVSGVMERWSIDIFRPLLHYSTTPTLQCR